MSDNRNLALFCVQAENPVFKILIVNLKSSFSALILNVAFPRCLRLSFSYSSHSLLLLLAPFLLHYLS